MIERGQKGKTMATIAKQSPRRLHHAAWVTRDMEATHHFYEDIINLPLTTTWAEKAFSTGRECCHTFFKLDDRSTLALLQWTNQDKNPIELTSLSHIAFEGDAETQQAIKGRLEAASHDIRVADHSYCILLYVNDPITCAWNSPSIIRRSGGSWQARKRVPTKI